MGKLCVPPKALTQLDRVRAALDEAEKGLINLRGAGPQKLHLLDLFDQIARDLEKLDLRNVDVRVERSRFEMIQGQLQRRRRSFLNEVSDALEPAREQVKPAHSRWWWYLDEAVAKQRRRRLLQVGALTTAVVALLLLAWLAYQRFLAPPPSVGQAFRRIEDGRRLVTEGDVREALQDFAVAADLTPQNPEPWLWQGVLYESLDEPDRAQDAFEVAQSLYDTAADFYLDRGRIYLEAGQSEKAETDTNRAIAENPEFGWSYYIRAGVHVRQGDYDRALADLDRSADLAQESGDRQLEALARAQQAQVVRMAPMLDPTP
jgi:tetratricopeptide (TPR) repeat protein